MARSSHLSRRNGGRYYLQIRLKSFSGRSPTRLVRFSLETCDYVHARLSVAERMSWLIPLQAARSSHQRYHHISAQLDAFNAQGPVTHREKLAARCNFEHVVRGLIDDMGGLKEDGDFNAAWMTFCQENLLAEKRIATDDRLDAYERGRADAMKALSRSTAMPAIASPPDGQRFDPTRPDRGIILTGQGNGYDTAMSDLDVILSRQASLDRQNEASSGSLKKVDARRMPIATLKASADQSSADPKSSSRSCPAAVRSDRDMLLSDFLEEFLKDRAEEDGDDRARSEIGPIVAFAIALLDDKHPASYTRQDFRKLNKAIPRIPTRKNIPSDVGRTLFARYRYAIENPTVNLEYVTVGTIKKNYHSGLTRFFEVLRKQQVMKLEPILGAVTPQNRVALPRDSFDEAEILKLLKLPLFTGCHSRMRCWTAGKYLIQGSLYWQYLILLLTGMRTGEVGPLKVTDIIETDGFVCFDLRPFDARKGRVTLAELRGLKTKSSSRIVPVHPLLVELGLLEHRDEMLRNGQTMLLPDCVPYRKPDGQLRWSQSITKSWAYVKNTLKIVDRMDVTLYSTRHTMAQMIDDLVLPERTRNRVLGHVTADSAGNYGRNGLLSVAEFKQFYDISNPLIDAMQEILMPAKRDADAGRLKLIRPTAPFVKKKSI